MNADQLDALIQRLSSVVKQLRSERKRRGPKTRTIIAEGGRFYRELAEPAEPPQVTWKKVRAELRKAGFEIAEWDRLRDAIKKSMKREDQYKKASALKVTYGDG